MTQPVTGTTRVAGIIGDPVGHSQSPAMHNAAYAACGLDWVYVAFPVAAGSAPRALDAMRSMGIAALNVTMPHKTDVAAACDVLTPTATELHAVNAVLVRDGALVGDSNDGEGLVRALEDEEVEVSGRRFLVLGAGGAGRASAFALGAAGAAVIVAARQQSRADAAARLLPDGEGIVLHQVDERLADVDVIVNATPVGMGGEPPLFDASLLTSDHFVYETIYHPSETPLLAAARARGARGANGLGMLVHQAASSFRSFTGVEPPLEVMRAAAS